jgi:tripartite-type tricarboxylate transporter receptor subunit TctC
MRILRGALAAVLLCMLPLPAGAQSFPDRPIRLIVPYGTGGITDITARIVAPAMADQLGQQVFVDNRPGGAGMIGFGATASAPADGYTLVLATTALAANPILFKSIPYDARKSFTPISLVGVVPMVAVVPAASPAKTLKEMVELARTKGSETNYGSAGNGSDNHLTAELFNHLVGIKVTHVPYRGGGQVMTDLVAGRLS